MNMKHKIFFLTALFAVLPSGLFAAHIGFMMPAGGQQGTSVEVIIGGQAFWNVDKAWISGKGVTVEKVQFVRGIPHPDGRQRRWIQQMLRNYHQGKKVEVPKPENTEGWRKHDYFDRLFSLSDCEREILYRFLFVPYNSLQASPAIAGRVIVTFKIAPDAPVGEREFRLLGRDGKLSNPLKFFVGKVPEYREDFFPFPPAVKTVPEFKIPGVINGQITPGETDSFRFAAKKGEKITFQLLGRFFNPFIGDGVPGHFQAVLEVVDQQKKVLAYADDHYFDPDPVLEFTVPADGEYTLRIRDAIYRGREDFVYRVNVFKGSLPAPVIKMKSIPAAEAASGPVAWPVTVKDSFLKPEYNSYQLALRKGEKLVAEIFSRRLGLPPDAWLKIMDKDGNILAHNDDTPRLKAGTVLHNSADPYILFTAPADGIYTVAAGETTLACGKDYIYFLRLDRPQKHFALYAVPSTLSLVAGSSNKLTLTVDRFDGFDGEIKLKVKSPASYRITGSDTIPAGCSKAVITITADHDRSGTVHDLQIEGSCGSFKTMVIPGDEGTQAFAYTHINPARFFPVRTLRKGSVPEWNLKTFRLTVKNAPLTLKIKTPNFYLPPDVTVSLIPENLPEWLTVVPDGKNRIVTKLVKLPKNRRKIEIPPLQISLQAQAGSKGKSANVIFKLQWFTRSKPDKNGKVRSYRQELLLPALLIGSDNDQKVVLKETPPEGKEKRNGK